MIYTHTYIYIYSNAGKKRKHTQDSKLWKREDRKLQNTHEENLGKLAFPSDTLEKDIQKKT